MKKIRLLLVLFMAFVLYPIHGQALSIACNREEMSRLKMLSSNMQMTYDIHEAKGSVTFTAVFQNPHPDIYIYDVASNRRYDYHENELVLSIPNLQANRTYRFEARTDLYNCGDDIIQTFYLSTPPYNPYYKDKICEGVSNYPLCMKWSKNTLSHDAFVKNVTEYKNSLNQKGENIKEEKREKTVLDIILDIYLNCYYFVLPIIIVGGGATIFIYNKKHSFKL